MHNLSGSFILGYHGCSKEVGASLLSGEPFKVSQNDYDWLGSGIYFWESNPKRAVDFAKEALERKKHDTQHASLVGAVIAPGYTLDLLTKAGQAAVKAAHREYVEIVTTAENELPKNTSKPMLNYLDCAVIEHLHQARKTQGLAEIQMVRGVFVEGLPLYPTSAFHDKSHIQIAVRDAACIKGVFRVHERDLK